jgi:RNA polymerase sigma-70 factor (ECF subfamily)
MMKQYSEAQLLLNLQRGCHQAFEEIYNRYADKLIAIALKKTGDEDEAMDMIQELFLSLWKNHATIQLNGSLAAYLTVSVNYMVFKWYKKRKVHPVPLAQVTTIKEGYEDSVSQKISYSELSSLIAYEVNNMPEKMRRVYLCSREQGMNGQQIAKELGLSHQTVRNQISNALSRLKKTVHRYYTVISLDNYRELLVLLIFFPFL